MPIRTRFLSRLIGLYCILVSLSMAAHRPATIEAMNAIMHDRPILFFAGVTTMIAGLAMVLSHNVWSGGTAAVIVSLVGWVTLFKGLLILFLSPQGEAEFLEGLHYEQLFYVYTAVTLLIGVYLTWMGFRSASYAVI